MSDVPDRGGASPPTPAIDFRRLAEVAAEPIAVHDAQGTVLWANTSAARLVAAPDAQVLVGRNIMEFVAPEQREMVAARAKQLATAGGALDALEQEFVRLDGTRLTVETSGAALGGGLTLVVVRDVSARVAAERARGEAELRLHAFFEGSADAIGIARDGRYVYVNTALASLFGYGAPAELIGKPLASVTSPAERDRVERQVRGRVARGGAAAVYRTRGLRRDGSEFELEVRATPFHEGDSAVTMAILRDVSAESAATAALQASEQRFRELFEFVPVSLWEVDASRIRAELDRLQGEGVDLRAWMGAHPEELARLARAFIPVSINAYGCQLAGGRDREEVLAHLDTVEIPEAAARYAELGLQLLEGRAVARAEGWGGTVGGERRLLETAATVLPGHEATWDRLILASVDVTDRRRSEARLTAIFDAAAEPMAFTIDGRFERVNAAFAKAFGFARPEEAIGLSVGELAAPSELPMLQGRHRRRLAGETPPDGYTTRVRRRDGTEFEVDVKTAGLREGDRIATVSIMRDVTEQRAWERQLTESERRFRELFDFVPVSLWEIDGSAIRAELDRLRAAGTKDLRAWAAAHPEELQRLMRSFRLVAINVHGCALTGATSPEELIANQEKVHTPDTAARYTEIGLQLLAGEPIARAEGWVGTLSGRPRWIETAARAMPGHEATWGRLLFASIDVTERRRAEEERAALHERLRQSEKLEAVGRLAGGIAHDFNNILSGILGYAELTLLAVERGTDVHDHQERIREAALRARGLVRQILTFSRRDRAAQRTVDVPAVVQEALGLMRAGIPATVTLEARIDPDAGATQADPTQIHQIVLNLCSNARDAVGPYGHILVEVAAVAVDGDAADLPAGPYVRLRVRDDGAGMDDETKARIFEPYMTTKGPFGGHGLGLPVVHGIVSAAGGAVRVESAPGSGATFDVYLPRRAPPQPEAVAPARSAAGRGERILIVDDEPLVLNAHRRLLESLGYSVTVAADGEAALRLFRESPHAFDLVLSDQTMPALSGADLARALLAIRADQRVILCTGYSDQIDEDGARQIGVRSLLQKPIDRDTLAAAVQVALRT